MENIKAQNTKLTEKQIEELKSTLVIAENWFAVCYSLDSTPIALFSEEQHAIAYRDYFTATSIVKPWAVVLNNHKGFSRC